MIQADGFKDAVNVARKSGILTGDPMSRHEIYCIEKNSNLHGSIDTLVASRSTGRDDHRVESLVNALNDAGLAIEKRGNAWIDKKFGFIVSGSDRGLEWYFFPENSRLG